jgi:hypothetical protein
VTSPGRTGFEARTRDPERRAFFDLQKRLSQVEAAVYGGPWDFQGTIPTPGPPTTVQDPLPNNDGDMWIDSNGIGWVWNGTAWVNVGSIRGPQGPPGAAGPPGPPGSVGTIAYVHDQATVSALWTITHNLGYFPAGIFVIDSSGSTVEGDVTQISVAQLTIGFSGGFTGKAYLS